MASGISVMVKALNIKGMHVDRVSLNEETVQRLGEKMARKRIDMEVRPYKKIRQSCPVCQKKCSCYDHKAKDSVSYRANSFNGVPVFLHYKPLRIQCPDHGVLTEYLPWRDGNSRFTPGLNNEIAFLALNAPKTVVSQYMDVNWKTVGHALKAAHNRIEPDVSQRLRGLKRICVDETSRQKGHTYITVVYDMDRNQVAWVHEGYGLDIFKIFCESLTEEERESIEVVAGDGARWIDTCTETYFVNARRCVDFFHVVGWTNDALDSVRLSAQRQAGREVSQMKEQLEKLEKEEAETKKRLRDEYRKAKEELESMPVAGRPSRRKRELQEYLQELASQLQTEDTADILSVTEEEYTAAKEELQKIPKRGRPSRRKIELMTVISAYEGKGSDRKTKTKLTPEHQMIIDQMQKKAEEIKGTKYTLGMNPENLSESMRDRLKILEGSYPEVYRAYSFKERLRIILHMKDTKTATTELDKWIVETSACGIKPFEELAEKIMRHREHILNAVELQANSSKSEACNTTIKALIKIARGFRNLDNMFALIYLRCSDLVIPLFNRYQPTPEQQKRLREIANERRTQREEGKRIGALHS